METMKNASPIRSLLSQTKNNTTLWIGHLQNDSIDHFGGQTFKCPSDGRLDNIQVYSSVIQRPGEMRLSLHEFDHDSKNWKQSFAWSSVAVSKNDESKWLSFSLTDISLVKDKIYGFRLQSPDAMVGIGELVRASNEPCSYGQEWNADSNNMDGVFFTWFSLAFKVEMVA
ncbi:MAG: hypothetical protein JWM28_742 [Chitinophagaceae bacterium]|nr:hypothetical protein [Chitinophagaceae bacterium]